MQPTTYCHSSILHLNSTQDRSLITIARRARMHANSGMRITKSLLRMSVKPVLCTNSCDDGSNKIHALKDGGTYYNYETFKNNTSKVLNNACYRQEAMGIGSE